MMCRTAKREDALDAGFFESAGRELATVNGHWGVTSDGWGVGLTLSPTLNARVKFYEETPAGHSLPEFIVRTINNKRAHARRSGACAKFVYQRAFKSGRESMARPRKLARPPGYIGVAKSVRRFQRQADSVCPMTAGFDSPKLTVRSREDAKRPGRPDTASPMRPGVRRERGCTPRCRARRSCPASVSVPSWRFAMMISAFAFRTAARVGPDLGLVEIEVDSAELGNDLFHDLHDLDLFDELLLLHDRRRLGRRRRLAAKRDQRCDRRC